MTAKEFQFRIYKNESMTDLLRELRKDKKNGIMNNIRLNTFYKEIVKLDFCGPNLLNAIKEITTI